MSDEIKISKKNIWMYSTFVLIALVVIGGIMLFSGGSTTGNGTGNSGTGVVSASLDDDAVLGDANAPVTIIEFSDYQCPFCARHFRETYPLLKSEYIDTGKVKLVFRDLPLTSIHPMAQPAAEAAECVRELGGDEAYYEYHDKIFENQQSLSTANLKSWATGLGYNIGTCLDSGKYASEVQKDSRDAQAAGFSGTPGFLIMKSGASSGTPLKGAYPFSDFKKIIDSLL
ncbi:MAG: DsbA family protein [Candidatus Pacearchaeota archaeon]